MKKCIKCKQQIPDDCDVCTYCGQWQEQIKEENFLKTTKQCVKCKQHIPIDCEECTYCGQTQPINENNAEKDNTINVENTEKEKLKKQWKIAGIVFISGVLFFVLVLRLVSCAFSTPKNKSHSSSSSYNYTEPTTVDNSVNGQGYYHFDNRFDESTVEKFNEVFYGDTRSIDLDVSIDGFSYEGDVMVFDEKVSQYNYIDFNGKTGVFIYVNDSNKIPAFTFTYNTNMLSDPTTSAEYVNKQLVARPASWIYALSDTLTYEQAYDIYKTLYVDEFLNEMVNAEENGRSPKCIFYYSGYTIIVSGSSNKYQDSITILKTDRDFIEKNDIEEGAQSIFSAVDTDTDENSAVSTTNGDTTEETTSSEPATVSDEEIAEAEDLLHQEPYGSDYSGSPFADKLNVLDAINYYIDDISLEATRGYDGKIILKYSGIFNTFNDSCDVTYKVDINNETVEFVDSSFAWESFKEFYPSDLHNDYMQDY